jgi:hypothetical protein
MVAPEADHYQAFLLGKDGLVYVPGSLQVRQNNRTHRDSCCGGGCGEGKKLQGLSIGPATELRVM